MLGHVRSLLAEQMAKSSPTPYPSKLSKLACSCCPRGAGRGAISDRAVKGPKYPVRSITGQGVSTPVPGFLGRPLHCLEAKLPLPLPAGLHPPARLAPAPQGTDLGPPGAAAPPARPPCRPAHRRLRPPGSELGAPAAPATLPPGGTEQLCS